eukprot:TRINITY_DN3184_c0_g1_i4.p2 TRINITY_DN3184_c0_g1~~TRINITY_DN3184_c0_g1_i4.p2  ORF type:complete len:183 (-),score=35.39 TRINITY_DN3184_c0_g1_i4:176-724(-)
MRSKKLKICSTCVFAKPPRTHHCRVCNRCILKMDHHCPWISNCVGFRNYKYFLMLLIYSAISLLFIAFTYWEEVILVVSNNTFSKWYVYLVFLEFLLSLTLGAILTGFSCLHLWMLSHNLTTIEFCENRDIANYDHWYSKYYTGGCDSYRAVLGTSPLFCFLPFSPNYEGEGLTFGQYDERY